MEAATGAKSRSGRKAGDDDEEQVEPSGVEKASDDTNDPRDSITPAEDAEATKWYLAAQPTAPEFTIPFEWLDHDKGEFTDREWVVKPLAPETLEAIEKRNTDENTGRLDSTANNAETLSTASIDPDPSTDEFRAANGGSATPQDAIRTLFRHQGGVVDYLAGEVRRISGYDPSRVGRAKPRLARAAGN